MCWIDDRPVLWLQNQEQRFEYILSRLSSMCTALGALSCMNTKSPDLNRREAIRQKWNKIDEQITWKIENCVYFVVGDQYYSAQLQLNSC